MGLEGYIYTKLAYKMENKISINPGQSCNRVSEWVSFDFSGTMTRMTRMTKMTKMTKMTRMTTITTMTTMTAMTTITTMTTETAI